MLKEIGRRKAEDLQRLMGESGVDALLLTEPISFYHLVFTRVAQLVVLNSKEDPFVVIHPYSREYVEQDCFSDNLVGLYPYQVETTGRAPFGSALAAAKELLGDSRKVGLDFAHTPHAKVAELRQALPGIEMFDCGHLLKSVFERKDEDEIGIIRKSVEIAEAGMRAAARAVTPGIQERVVALEAEYRMRQLGASGFEFPSNANSGTRGCWLGLPASEKTIEPGDPVAMDFGPIYRGYYGDICRTLPCETAQERFVEMFDLVEAALKLAVASIGPDVAAEQVDGVVRSFYAEKGWDGCFIHHTGHPVGNLWGPWLIPGCRQHLEEGMVLALEPGLYRQDYGGVRLEVDVVVRKSGAEVLGSLPLRIW